MHPMAKRPAFYPPSPTVVPEDLTVPSLRYRRQINVVSFTILLFFIVYASIILLCLMLSATFIFAKAGALGRFYPPYIVLGVLFLIPVGFLIKSLFARQPWGKGYEIEVHPDEHPRLFQFLECVCAEVDAPMPHRVLVNCDVNAAAGSSISLMSLIREPERELILGLGLINVLNMTEFKALLAHEFAHLSQHDMKTAPYIRLGMKVVSTILGQYRALEWLFIFVVKLQLKLMREMEYHADLTAVSVAGSDAVPQLLYKCLWGDHCMQQTVVDLDRAREHRLYSTDIFVHHMMAAKHLRQRRKDPTIGVPPILPEDREETVQMFKPDEDELAEMWNDHPSNYDRELNAKARYVRTDFAKASPWELFDNVAELRRAASAKFYKQVFNLKKKVDWSHPRDVQVFLEDEFAETNFDFDRYGVLYNHRNLQAIDLRHLMEVSAKERNAPAELLKSHRTMYPHQVRKFAEAHLRHIEEMNLLNAIHNGWIQPKKDRFKMRGKRFGIKSARKLIKELDREIAADNAWLAKFDTRVFVTYYEIALGLDVKKAEELAKRYRFHYVLQNLWIRLREHEGPMNFMFDFLASLQGSEIDDKSFHFIIEVFRNAYDAAKYVLQQAELAKFPELVNMPAGEPVRPYLLKGNLPSKPTHFDESLRVKWLISFSDKFREMQKRLDRLHFKSLGAILTLQEQLGSEALKKWAAADATPSPPVLRGRGPG
jgi:Zn-dependent protease with chaperone function